MAPEYAGTPVVTTPVGAEGLDLVQGEHALAKLDHGYEPESLEEIYDRPGAAPRPWLPEEDAAE